MLTQGATCAVEFVGGVAAGLTAGPLYGTHAPWLAKILPWVKSTEHGEDGGDDNGLENQTSNVGETEMQAPLYAAKHSKGTKLTADGASTMV